MFSEDRKIGKEIFKNHDLRIFHIITGAKKYLVTISKKEKQQKKEKKESGRRLSFSRKRYLDGE